MRKKITFLYILGMSALILCSKVYGQDNWQLYDDFNLGTIDPNKWDLDDSSAIVTIENGRVKFMHQAGNASDSSWLTITDKPETIIGVKATITVDSCDGDVLSRIASIFGKLGASDNAFSEQAIRPDKEYISATVRILGPAPDYKYKSDYYWGHYKFPLGIIGVPFTMSTILSSSNAMYWVEDQGELEYSFLTNLEPLEEGQKFFGLGTRSSSGIGECTVYFDDVYILKKRSSLLLSIVPILATQQEK